MTIPLFALPGEMGLKYTLYYNSDLASTAFPPESWRSSLEYRLDLYCGLSDPYVTCNHVTLFRPDGSSIQFSGNWSAYGSHPEIGGDGLATLTHNSNGTWTLHDEDATTQTYDSDGFLTSIKDASGIGWSINTSQTTIPPYTTKTTIVVTHTNGQSFSVVKSYNSSSRSMSVIVEDPANNIYSYVQYGTDLDIISLTLPGTPATTITFNYTGSNPLLSGVDYNNTPYWTTSYNGTRVSSDGAADSTERTSIVYAFQSGGMVATITNPLGLTTTNTYKTDAQGNYLLASVSNSAVQGCGATVNTMAWDGNDNVTRTVDNDGVTTTYDYAPNGQLQTKAEAAGTPVARTINYTWDPDAQLNRLLSMTIPGESRTSYTYNAQNRLASVAKTNLTDIGAPNQSLTTAYAYTLYSNGMVHTMIVTQPSPNGSDHITYAYDTHGNLTSATDGLGHVTTYSGYNGLNEVGKVVGPNGAETDYTYDARGRVASKTTHPNGTTAAWTYAYDGFGLLSQINAPDGEVTSWSRDAEKRIKTIAHNDKDGASTETFIYDANGDVTSDVIARGSDIGKSTSYAYNALGKVYQIKGSHGQVKTYAYDGNGNVLSVTDALGHKTRYTYDALNRVVGITNAASGVTSYAYDAGDHVIGVEDPRGLVTSYAWDGFGQLWRQISPDTGTTTFRYDAYGRLSYKQRADGMPEYFGYDALNRVLSRGTSEYGAQDFTWDNCTNGIGRLCTSKTDLISNQYTVGYNYTQEGQVSKRAFSFSNGTSYSVGYSYDNMGHLA
ncbi:MAG: RHS repeat-associated core domain-containing protein, partial [Terriglobia bacterium]